MVVKFARVLFPAALPMALAVTMGAPAPAVAGEGQYDFASVPATDLNRVFRVNRETGEVGACQYGLGDKNSDKNRSIGVTLCYPAGEGAGPQTPSDYRLVASHHDREAGIYRVDLRSGAMSICYVLEDTVVCTPMAR